MLSNYSKLELADSKEHDAVNSSLIYHAIPESIKPCSSPTITNMKQESIHIKTPDIAHQNTEITRNSNIPSPTIQFNYDQNAYLFTQPHHIQQQTTEDVNFEEIKNNGPPYQCPLCTIDSYSFATWSNWIAHWNSFHFLDFFQTHINNIEEEKKQTNVKSAFVENILFHETYFAFVMEYFTPKQYIQSISLISKFHYFFLKKRQYNFQIMLRMIRNQFFDIKSCSIIPAQNIYEIIKWLHHFTLNVNLSHILPFTKHTIDAAYVYKFRVYPDTTIKSILWQYDLLQMHKSLEIGYLKRECINYKPLKWNLSTRIFDIVSEYNSKNIIINLNPKSSTFSEQLKFIRWFIPEIKNDMNLPTVEIEHVKRRSCSIKTQLKTCSSLPKLKKYEFYINKCINRIHNNNAAMDEKINELEMFNQFYIFSSKVLSIDQVMENKMNEYERKCVILNEHIVRSKVKAQRVQQRAQINVVEREISRMDIDAFEMDEEWITTKKQIISDIETAVKKQKNKVLGKFEQWELVDLCVYLGYVYEDKIKLSKETLKKFQLFGLDGSKIIDINDSLLILCGVENENMRKLLMKAINELLDNYGTHRYCKTQICCICTVNEVNTVCIPCGHICYCTECRKQCMRHTSTSKCPICRTKIIKIVQIYKAGMTK